MNKKQQKPQFFAQKTSKKGKIVYLYFFPQKFFLTKKHTWNCLDNLKLQYHLKNLSATNFFYLHAPIFNHVNLLLSSVGIIIFSFLQQFFYLCLFVTISSFLWESFWTVLICENLFLFMIICENLFLKSYSKQTSVWITSSKTNLL